MESNKNQTTENNKSNAERDQDEEGMNNGTIGGNMGVIDSSNDKDKASSNPSDQKETASNGTGGKNEGS